MRIAEIAPAGLHPYSGVLTVICRLSAALARRGHDVELWQLSPWAADGAEDGLAEAGVDLVRCHVDSALRLGPRVADALANRRPDVAHLHNSFSPANNLLARRIGVPYLLTAHGGYAPEQLAYHRFRKRLFARLMERPLLAGARRVVALTEVERGEIAAMEPGTVTVVVPNAVEPPPAGVDGHGFRRSIGVGDGDRLVVFVGKLDHYHKRVGELVAAVAAAPPWHLALVGPDWRCGQGKLEAQAARLGIRDRVHLVLPLRGRRLHEAFAAADLFALMSRWEGLSMSLLEALAMGRPAAVSPEVELRLGVAAAGAGWQVQPHKLSILLDDLTRMEPEAWERRAAAARAYAGRVSWDDVAARYEELFAGAVSVAR